MTEREHDYDLITIGAGSGGVRASRLAAGHGARVAVVESRDLGGTCVNLGCIPKKLLSYAAHYHEDFEDARGFGWTLPSTPFDWPRLIAAKDAAIARLNGIYERLLTESGVVIVRGRARLTGPHHVQVGDKTWSARRILVASGSRPVRPAIPGAEHMITSDEAFHLPVLPRRVLVYGAGYIGVEFASIFNGLGVETTLVYRSLGVLRGFDTEIGAQLATEMAHKGVMLRPSSQIARVTRGEALQVELADGSVIQTDCVLCATGRAPNSGDLGLEAAGVALGAHGAIPVDETFTTCVPSIHAIGDVTDRIQLTPVALAEAMVFVDRWFGGGQRAMHYENVPTAVFSHPNVASVGLTEEGARAAGYPVRIFTNNFSALKHMLSGRPERSLLKLVVDAASDRVLGVHMLGPDAGEVMQGFAVCLTLGITKAQLDRAIGIHPTVAEELLTMRTPRV